MKRAFAFFLACVFLLGLLPASALAAEPYTGGLCPHHLEHSYEVCGYIEAVEGHPCGHVHDGNCGYVEAVPEVPCDMGCIETNEDGQIIHAEGCAYAPAVVGAPCQHEHDELCGGYVEAVAGQPCGYVCRICPVQAMIDALLDAESITPDNRAGVEAQLDAISEAWAELTDEEAGQLDTARCEAAISALLALDGQNGANEPMPLAAGDVSYRFCNANGQNWQTGTKNSGAYTLVTANDTAWSNGWYVVSGDVTIGSTSWDGSKRVTVTGDVHLILEDGCNLTVHGGIEVADDDKDITNGSPNTLTIYGQQGGTGQLTAIGRGRRSGIGSVNSGTITINGGTVTANGDEFCAGIGGGNYLGVVGRITINGGTVSANGGKNGGAGIGGGSQSDGGIITINGGTVVAAGSGAGIGSGDNPRSSCKITISGGTITATSDYSAGIGGSFNGDGGTITISGGTVTANGGGGSAGIGGGSGGTGGTIYITGGTITARGGYWGAGIGGGFQRDGGTITISGGIVTATGGNESAGIGGAQLANGGNITVDGNAVVFATGGTGAGSNIGKGTSSGNYNDGTKTFNSGVVFEGNNGIAYGSCSLPGDMTI